MKSFRHIAAYIAQHSFIHRVLVLVLVALVLVDGPTARAIAQAKDQTENQRPETMLVPSLQSPVSSPAEAPAQFYHPELGTTFQVTRPITYIIPSAVAPLDLPPGTFNVALLGVDTRPQFKYKNTDVIVIASINPAIPSVTLLSIPRDTLVYIPRRYVWKINQAYAIGGFDMFKQTIAYNFGINVDHYAMVNFEALVHTVELFGGVDVVATCPIYHIFPRDPYYIGDRVVRQKYTDRFTGEEYPIGTFVPTQTIDIPKPGVYTLNGLQSLAYVRARKGIPGGDVDRGRREIRMIRSLFTKAKQLGTLTKIPELLTRFEQDMQTDYTVSDLLALAPMAEKFNDAVIRSRFLDPGGANGQVLTDETLRAGGVSNAFWKARREYLQNVLTVAINQKGNESIPIEVLNGTSDAGFALAAADRLGELGLRVVDIKAADKPYAESMILDHTTTKKGSAVPLLSRTFDIAPTNILTAPNPTGARYSVIIGSDFNTCYYAKSLQESGSTDIDFGSTVDPDQTLPDVLDVTAPLTTETPAPQLATATPEPTAQVTSPTATPEPTATNTSADATPAFKEALVIVANGDVVNIRQQPSLRGRIIGKLVGGQQATIVGRSEDGAWLEIQMGGRNGWVNRSVVRVSGDASDVPVR